MADVTTPATSLLDAINISLSCLGETPVSAVDNTSTNVVLAKQIIEEVSRDIQSKGWWFNTSGTAISILSTTDGTDTDGNISFNASIPEEARRYISIRSARILQSRFVGSEELQKFSFQEEQVSLAILTQAHVRNGGNSTSFTAFPADLKNLGIEEVLFLQQSAEEKLLTLRLHTELKQTEKLAAETDLTTKQSGLTEAQKLLAQAEASLKTQQTLTEVEETSKRAAEKLLVDAQELKTDAETALVKDQEALTAQQTLTEAQETSKRAAEGALLLAQELKVDAEKLLVDAQELKTDAETTLTTKQGALVDAQELKTDQETALITKQVLTEASNKLLIDAQELKTDAEKLLVDSQSSLVDAQTLTEAANKLKVDAEVTLLSSQKLKTDAEKLLVDAQAGLVTNQAATELKQALKLVAETSLIADQEALVTQQALTEVQETTKRTREAELIDAQETLIQKQILTEAEQVAKVQEEVDLLQTQDTLVTNQAATELKKALDIGADTTLKGKQGLLVDAQELKTDAETALMGSQKTQLDAQTAIEATAEKLFYEGVILGTQSTYRDYAAEMRMMGVQESMFQQTPAYKKVELLKDAEKLRTSTATETGTDATEIAEVNKVMRLIGEPPVSTLNQHSLASECVRLLRDTDMELQGRGWYFNTTDGVDGEEDTIAQKPLIDCPRKYLEYLEVRTAILMTELYPQSGVDIQRLPKMEAELRAYFKDRENDDANYNIFNNYDTASIMGVNRNYSIL